MPFATATLNALLNAVHGKATYTAPATIYLGWLTATPTAAGGNVVEPSTTGTAYARTAVPAASFGMAASGSITNTAIINSPIATGAGWGTATYVGLFDSATVGGGNLLFFAPIAAQSIPAGVGPSLPVGAATSTLV